MLSQSTTKPTRRRLRVYFGVCEWCECYYSKHQYKHRRFCSHGCYSANRGVVYRGVNHPTYKGRVKHHAGYVRVWIPGHPLASKQGYVAEHRLVLYEAGIAIPSGSHVHHINGDKGDNRLENLSVHPAGEHHRNHIQAAGYVTNQYGRWPLLTAEQRERKLRYGERARYI